MDRNYSLHDLLAALRRRRGIAIGIFLAALALGTAIALLVPAEYTARSVVQIEPRRQSFDFFPAQNATPFEDRMRTIKHGILSRPILEQVVRETDFFPELAGNVDEAVERMRRHVEVRLEGEVPAGAPALLFVVEVRGEDPDRVERAAALLPKLYEARTREVLLGQARALRETLDAQVKELGGELAGHEARITAFKARNAASLPEVVEDHARAMGRLQSVLELRIGAIADARRRRSSLLASIPEGPSVSGMAEAGLDAARRKLDAVKAAYGPRHPDVLRAGREYQEALSRRDEELGRWRDERLGGELSRLDKEVEEDEADVAALRTQLAELQGKIDAAPRIGQELSTLSRDQEVVRGKYAATVSRRADAAAAEALLAADQGTMFRTVDPAGRPARPSAPDRARLLWLAFLAALAAGFGAAGLAEWLDPSMRGPEDAASLPVPVLAAVPRIGPRRAS
ncbi:MAG: Wzz/FepE/Etk N-terminal domain-containing protein [Anaeromyxobacteraceae bacterium]